MVLTNFFTIIWNVICVGVTRGSDERFLYCCMAFLCENVHLIGKDQVTGYAVCMRLHGGKSTETQLYIMMYQNTHQLFVYLSASQQPQIVLPSSLLLQYA